MNEILSVEPNVAPGSPDRARDVADFDALYLREHASVYRDVLLICGSKHTADDLTQEAFARAWARWSDVAAMQRPGGWVRTVAVRAAIKHKQRHQDWDELRDRAAEDVAVADFDTALLTALAALSPQQRAAIVLTVVDERPVTEVATLLRCSTATVRVHVFRARRALAGLYRTEVPR